MLRKSYTLNRELSDIPELPAEFWTKARFTLDKHINVIVDHCKGCGSSHRIITDVLYHVFHRTVPFSKVVEQITYKEIRDGIPSLLIRSSGMSKPSAYNTLKALSREGILVKATADWGRSVSYGLNLPKIFGLIWEAVKDSCPKKGTPADEERERIRFLKEATEKIAFFYDMVKEIAVSTYDCLWREVCNIRNKFGEKMGRLKETIVEAAERSKKASARRIEKRGAYPLFEDGKPKGGRLVDFFNGAAMKRKEDYPGFVPVKTGKLCGMASNWLNELKAEFESEAAIRGFVEDVVENWKSIAGTPFTAGEYNFEKVVKDVPDLAFLYRWRKDLRPLIVKRVADGYKKEIESRGKADFNIVDF